MLCETVRQILLPEHPPLPCGDLGNHIGEKPQRVIGREDGYAEHVTHGDEDEEMFHARPGLECKPRGIMRGHAVDELPNDLVADDGAQGPRGPAAALIADAAEAGFVLEKQPHPRLGRKPPDHFLEDLGEFF